jgi:hypothetical protein
MGPPQRSTPAGHGYHDSGIDQPGMQQAGGVVPQWQQTAEHRAGVPAGLQYSPEQQVLLYDARNQQQHLSRLPPGVIQLQQQQQFLPLQVAPGQLQMAPGGH